MPPLATRCRRPWSQIGSKSGSDRTESGRVKSGRVRSGRVRHRYSLVCSRHLASSAAILEQARAAVYRLMLHVSVLRGGSNRIPARDQNSLGLEGGGFDYANLYFHSHACLILLIATWNATGSGLTVKLKSTSFELSGHKSLSDSEARRTVHWSPH